MSYRFLAVAVCTFIGMAATELQLYEDIQAVYTNNLKNRFLAASVLPHISRFHSSLCLGQRPLAPNGKSGEPPCQIPDSSGCLCIKPKILIVSSKSGGGHTAAVDCLRTIFEDRYQFQVIHPFTGDFNSVWGYLDGVYNFILRNQLNRLVNFYFNYVQAKLSAIFLNETKRQLTPHIDKYMPDLIISISPIINCGVGLAAKERGIPYLMITTDYDLEQWVYGLEKLNYPHFKITTAENFQPGLERLYAKGISPDSIEPIGLPTRLDFFEKKEVSSIKEQNKIPANKKVVLLMMGGAGSTKVFEYAKHILSMNDLNIHLLVCIGKSEKLKNRLLKLKTASSNSFSIIPFTPKISDLIAISDLVITKPGPGSINEAMTFKIPVLVDHTGTCLQWEKANIDHVLNLGIGDEIKNLKNLNYLINKYLYNEDVISKMSSKYRYIEASRFHLFIGDIINQMLNNPTDRITGLGFP